MNKNITKHFPSILQSLGMIGIIMLIHIVMEIINFIIARFFYLEFNSFTFYGIIMGLSLLIFYFIRKKYTNEDLLKIKPMNIKLMPSIFLGTICLIIGVISPIGNMIPMPEFFENMFGALYQINEVILFINLVIVAPFFEELIFRSVILDGFLKRYSPFKSIIASSLIFGFIHLNPWQFIAGFVLGAFIGWVYYKTKNLLWAIFIHLTANLNGFILLILSKNNSYGKAIEKFENDFLVIIGAILIAILSFYFIRKELYKKS